MAWVLSLLLASLVESECKQERHDWNAADVPPPCRVASPEAFQRNWGLGRAQAECAAHATSAERRLRHERWLICLDQWPDEILIWRASALSIFSNAERDVLLQRITALPPERSIQIADAIIGIAGTPYPSLLRLIAQRAPERLTTFFADPRIGFAHKQMLAHDVVRQRVPTESEWKILLPHLVRSSLSSTAVITGAKYWLLAPRSVRETFWAAPKPPERDPLMGLRPWLALGLIALGEKGEAAHIELTHESIEESLRSTNMGPFIEAAIAWHLEGYRARTPWDASIEAMELTASWEAWSVLLPYLFPYEQLLAPVLAEKHDRDLSDDDAMAREYVEQSLQLRRFRGWPLEPVPLPREGPFPPVLKQLALAFTRSQFHVRFADWQLVDLRAEPHAGGWEVSYSLTFMEHSFPVRFVMHGPNQALARWEWRSSGGTAVMDRDGTGKWVVHHVTSWIE